MSKGKLGITWAILALLVCVANAAWGVVDGNDSAVLGWMAACIMPAVYIIERRLMSQRKMEPLDMSMLYIKGGGRFFSAVTTGDNDED